MDTFLAFLNENTGALTVIFTAIVTLATVVYAVLTAALVKETRQMRQAQTEPHVDVSFKMRDETLGFLDIAVRNIGIGPAYDIHFSIHQVAGDLVAAGLMKELKEIHFLQSGVRYISPGQELKSFFTSMYERYDAKLVSQISIEITYKNAVGSNFKENFLLDFSELKGITRIGEPPLLTIAKHVKKLSEEFDKVTSSGRLRVDTFTSEDRRSEQLERQRRLDESRK